MHLNSLEAKSGEISDKSHVDHLFFWLFQRRTVWKVSKYEVFSGPYFPVFGLNTEFSPNTGKYGPENTHAQ